MRKFQFQVFGPPQGNKFALDIRTLTAEDFGASERWLLVSLPNVKAIPKGGERLFLTGGKGEEPVPLSHSRDRLAGSLDLGELGSYDLGELAEASSKGGDGIVTAVKPEGITATVSIDRDDKPGALLGFDAAVRDLGSGTDLGGIRLLTLQT